LIELKERKPGNSLHALFRMKTPLTGDPWSRIADARRVYLMCPIWAWSSVPAMNAFADGADFTDKDVYIVTFQHTVNPQVSYKEHQHLAGVVARNHGSVRECYALVGAKMGQFAGEEHIQAQINMVKLPEEPPVEAAQKESPQEDEAPAEEPVGNEELVLEEAPVFEDEPVLEEEPVLKDEPVAEEEPVLEEEPVAEDEPVLRDEPIPEEASVCKDEPVVEEAPVSEESVPQKAPVSEEPELEETPVLEEASKEAEEGAVLPECAVPAAEELPKKAPEILEPLEDEPEEPISAEGAFERKIPAREAPPMP